MTGRPARLVAFDWDRTVAAGITDVTVLRGPIERLLREGVLVVIAASGQDALEPQLAGAIRGRYARNLVVVAPRDRMTSVIQELAQDRGIGPDEILILDEASPGQHALERLAGQAVLYPVHLPATPEQDPAWIMVEDGFVVAREHEIESVFAIGNGFVGSRGSLAEGSPLSDPATFLAGVFEPTPGGGRHVARVPEWIRVAGHINEGTVRIDVGEIVEHRRTLDMRQGILWRYWRQRDDAGRITKIEGMRLASLADRHLLLQSITMTPENYSGTLTVDAPATPRVLSIQIGSDVQVALTAAGRIEHPEGRDTVPLPTAAPGEPLRWSLDLDLGRTYRLDRMVCVHTSREVEDPVTAAVARLGDASARGFERVLEDHCATWAARWADSDVVIEGDLDAQRAIRFAMYHLISAANPNDPRTSIGARALTGPGYQGHVFWDTDIFMLPFFTLTYPEAARALVGYRHHTLAAARRRAAGLGYRGALYAWESADTGDDVTPPVVVSPTGEIIRIHVGEQEQHISADVAYGVWSYWHATGDERFLLDAGAEILLETARFWASRAGLEPDGKYHIRRVIGPDEYHVGVDDNAYTNGMAQWNLETAIEAAALLRQRWPARWDELARRLDVRDDEPRAWREVAERMYTGFDPRTGLFEQFAGYFELEDVSLADFEPRAAPMDVLLGHGRVQRTQILKQADVVMLLYLLGDRFPARVREANFRYYERRTDHGSSLSPPIHAAMAAQLGDVELAMRYLRQTAEIDLANGMGNAARGVHAAALGGLWQAVVFGFAGLALPSEGPRLEPRLPQRWGGLRFTIQWRGARVPVDLSRNERAATAVEEVHQ